MRPGLPITITRPRRDNRRRPRDGFPKAEVILHVRALGANPQAGRDDLEILRPGQVVVGMCDPLGNPEGDRELADLKATVFALEMIPRITRAQSMDVLSSMATIAGYKAVLQAADRLPKLFPMLMTAAGTLVAAKVLVIGAGVAGLQAIASARRLGAVVQAYDVRPVVKEQIESLGAKFVELDLDTGDSEDQGGYAKQLTDEQIKRSNNSWPTSWPSATSASAPRPSRETFAGADHRRRRAPHAARLGDCRSGGGAGRKL